MSNNSLTMTSTLVKKSFKVKNISVSPAQSYRKEPASLWMPLSCFSVPKYLCKTPAEVYQACSNGKIYPPNTQAYSSTFHPKENPLMGSSFLKKTVLFLPWAQQDAEELSLLIAILHLYRKDVHAAKSYFHSTQCFSLEFEDRHQISWTIFTVWLGTFSNQSLCS